MRCWCGLFILLFFIPRGLAAQSATIDSLKAELASLKEDSLSDEYPCKNATLSFYLGKALHEHGIYQDAEIHLRTALRFAGLTADSLLLAYALNLLGTNHFLKGETDSAIFYLKGGLQIAHRIQSLENIKTASSQLYTIHKEKNRPAEALQYYELYQSAKDTLIKGQHIRTLTRLEKDYTTRIERYEDTAKLHAQHFINMIALFGFIAALLIILLILVYYRQKQSKELEIRKVQEQLLMQERMASLGMLTAGIVHEIKNPLNFINNFAGVNRRLVTEMLTVMKHDPPDDHTRFLQGMTQRLHDLEENSKDIETSGKEINHIVHTMMDHSRGITNSVQLVDLNELTEENIKLVYQSYRADHPGLQVRIVNDLDPDLPKIEIYAHNIARVIINILGNAFYALNLKQEMTSDFVPCLEVSSRSFPDGVELTIRDNGTGIPPELQEKIFKPFFTTKPTGLGNSGLGLSISYTIVVHEHHGKLEVESEPGAFTLFRLVLLMSISEIT